VELSLKLINLLPQIGQSECLGRTRWSCASTHQMEWLAFLFTVNSYLFWLYSYLKIHHKTLSCTGKFIYISYINLNNLLTNFIKEW